jgi:hypothetical protein
MTCLLNWIGEQATASATADPYGMTNNRTDKGNGRRRKAEERPQHRQLSAEKIFESYLDVEISYVVGVRRRDEDN